MKPPARRVAVLGRFPDTTDGLCAYLASVGVSADPIHLPVTADALPSTVTVAVVFPDDLEGDEAVALLSRLRAARPALRLVVVTRALQRLTPSIEADGVSADVIVLPRPAFGWAILDAIRSADADRQP